MTRQRSRGLCQLRCVQRSADRAPARGQRRALGTETDAKRYRSIYAVMRCRRGTDGASVVTPQATGSTGSQAAGRADGLASRRAAGGQVSWRPCGHALAWGLGSVSVIAESGSHACRPDLACSVGCSIPSVQHAWRGDWPSRGTWGARWAGWRAGGLLDRALGTRHGILRAGQPREYALAAFGRLASGLARPGTS